MEDKSGCVMKTYELGRVIGQGTFAKVYHARSIKTGQSVAIKMIDKDKVMRAGMMEQVKREISVMRMVRHPNIIHLYEVMATKTKIFMVMEYAKGGELFGKVSKGRMKEDDAHRYSQQLISAVDFCHSRGVYHRDLKPENLLLDENENLKVTDFGLSALAQSKRRDGLLHTVCGTPAYVAPEVIHEMGYDGAKSDVWSCGVILFVMLAGFLPFQDPNLMEMYRKIEKVEFKFPKWSPQDVRRLITRMLDPDPETRIPMEKIKESVWFRKKFISEPQKMEPEGVDSESKQESIKPKEMNAFDIISLSCGFDLSGLFAETGQEKGTRFSSRKPADVVVSKLKEAAKRLKLRTKQIDKGLLKFESVKEGKKGAVSINAEIFELADSLYLVEMRKSGGDTVEYRKMMKEDFRPAIQDIVWVWQGEQNPHHEEHS